MSRSRKVLIDSKLMYEVQKRKKIADFVVATLYEILGNVLGQMKQFCPHLVWIISPDHIHSKRFAMFLKVVFQIGWIGMIFFIF